MTAPRTAAAFARAHQRLFAQFGEAALLRTEPVIVVITMGAEIIGEYGEVAHAVTTATFPAPANPQPGETFTARTQAWHIDRIEFGDEHIVTCIIRPQSGPLPC